MKLTANFIHFPFDFILFSTLHLVSPCLGLDLSNPETEDFLILGGIAAGALFIIILLACCCCRKKKSKSKPKMQKQTNDLRDAERLRDTRNDQIVVVNEQQSFRKAQQLEQVNNFHIPEQAHIPVIENTEMVKNDHHFIEQERHQPSPSPPPEFRKLNDLIHLELQETLVLPVERRAHEIQPADDVLQQQLQPTIIQMPKRKSNDSIPHGTPQSIYTRSESSKTESVITDESGSQQQSEQAQLKRAKDIELAKNLYSPKQTKNTDGRFLYENHENDNKALPAVVRSDTSTHSDDSPQEQDTTEMHESKTEIQQRMPRIKKLKENSAEVGVGVPRDSLQKKRKPKAKLNSVDDEGVGTAYNEQSEAPPKRTKSKRTTKNREVESQSPEQVHPAKERRRPLVAEENVKGSDSDSDKSAEPTERIQPRKHWKSIFNQY